MGKIISVVGNLGAGKTTLTKLLCERGSFTSYSEQPEQHPFHTVYGKDQQRWALANQIDFFLFRCQQEALVRQGDVIAVFDGGFDQDFHVYTRHIFDRGYLNQDEFNVCERFYHLTRKFLPPPDLIIRIIVDIPTIVQRRALRRRISDDHLFGLQELTAFDQLIDQWFTSKISSPVIQFSFTEDFHSYSKKIDKLVVQIMELLAA
jgi:deoxyadenosine/deoxycytidine kinase